MSRILIRTAVMRLVDELNDGVCYTDEGRYHEVVGLLSSIDWGVVPVDVIRSVLSMIIDRVPLKVLSIAPQQRNLIDEARDSVKVNAGLRAEHAKPTWYATIDTTGGAA